MFVTVVLRLGTSSRYLILFEGSGSLKALLGENAELHRDVVTV